MQARAIDAASLSTDGSRFSPNITVAVFKIPPHSRHGGSGSPASMRANASSMELRAPHAVHTTERDVPCSSSTLRAGRPACWCRPSVFCVITRSATAPEESSSAIARCAAFGRGSRAYVSRRICQERRRTSGSVM